MTRILLTGSTGFVGRPTLLALARQGHEVHAISRAGDAGVEGVHWHAVDLLGDHEVMEEIRPEVLIHLAWYAEHGKFWDAPENLPWVEASLRLLRRFEEAGGRRALIAGTCAEYEWGGQEDLREDHTPLRPASLYGVCKDALRRIAEAYAAQSELELAWARLFFMYGPDEAPGRLVPAVIRPLLRGHPAQTTAGGQVRDFMHVEDVARALVAIAQSPVTGAVNVASGRPVALAEVIDLIGELTGAGELVERGARPTPPSDPPRIVADVGRLEREVGFHSEIGLREGLASTIQWWRERPGGPTA